MAKLPIGIFAVPAVDFVHSEWLTVSKGPALLAESIALVVETHVFHLAGHIVAMLNLQGSPHLPHLRCPGGAALQLQWHFLPCSFKGLAFAQTHCIFSSRLHLSVRVEWLFVGWVFGGHSFGCADYLRHLLILLQGLDSPYGALGAVDGLVFRENQRTTQRDIRWKKVTEGDVHLNMQDRQQASVVILVLDGTKKAQQTKMVPFSIFVRVVNLIVDGLQENVGKVLASMRRVWVVVDVAVEGLPVDEVAMLLC